MCMAQKARVTWRGRPSSSWVKGAGAASQSSESPPDQSRISVSSRSRATRNAAKSAYAVPSVMCRAPREMRHEHAITGKDMIERPMDRTEEGVEVALSHLIGKTGAESIELA